MIDWIVDDAYPTVPKGIASKYPNNKVKFRFDDMVAMVGAAQAGLGFVRLPMFPGRASAVLVQIPVLPPAALRGYLGRGTPRYLALQKAPRVPRYSGQYLQKNIAVSS